MIAAAASLVALAITVSPGTASDGTLRAAVLTWSTRIEGDFRPLAQAASKALAGRGTGALERSVQTIDRHVGGYTRAVAAAKPSSAKGRNAKQIAQRAGQEYAAMAAKLDMFARDLRSRSYLAAAHAFSAAALHFDKGLKLADHARQLLS